MSKDRDSVRLAELNQGDLIRATAGTKPDVYTYDFLVETPGVQPSGLLTQKNPDGTVLGPETVLLEGTGRRLTRRQNPVQDYDGQVTISYGEIFPGGNLILVDPNEKVIGRRVELMASITAIQVFPSKS